MREPLVSTEPPPALPGGENPADGALVRFPAEVDIACAAFLRERMLALLNRGAPILVADLTATTFCDCAGPNALLRARTHAQALRTPFGMLISTTGPAWKVFRVTGLSDAIPHAPTLAELIPRLHARPG